jgi:WD40 repeat protein
MVSACSVGTLNIWKTATGQHLRTIQAHFRAVNSLKISPDGNWILTASEDKDLKIWDAANGQCLQTLKGHQRKINTCAISPDGTWIVSASLDNTLKIWDTATGRCLRTLKGHGNNDTGLILGINECAVSSDGTWIVSAGGDQTLKIWDTSSGQCLRTLEGHTGGVLDCAINPDGHWIVSTSSDTTIKVWDAATGQCLHTFVGYSEEGLSCAVSPDGNWIVCSSWEEKMLFVLEASTGQLMLTVPLPGSPSSVAMHPWAPSVMYGDAGGAINLLDLVGINYGPIIVTASNREDKLIMRCPSCQQVYEVRNDQLGKSYTCPTHTCGLRFKLNPFVIQPLKKETSLFGFLRK